MLSQAGQLGDKAANQTPCAPARLARQDARESWMNCLCINGSTGPCSRCSKLYTGKKDYPQISFKSRLPISTHCSQITGVAERIWILRTSDGRQRPWVCAGQRHGRFIRLWQVGVAAELLLLGQLREEEITPTQQWWAPHNAAASLPSCFLLSCLLIWKAPLTRLQSNVLVRSLSSVMKIMLLLFFFFLLFLILTSVSPTVTTISSTVFELTLPLERWRTQDVGDSGPRSLTAGRKRARS